MSRRWLLALIVVAGLAGCGEAPYRTHVVALQSADAEARRNAALALGRMGQEAAPAASALVEAIVDEDAGVRQAASRALGEIGAATSEAKAALKDALDDRDLSVRLAAAFALLKLDPQGRAYAPVLTDAMRSGEGGTIVAVGRLGPAAAWAVPTLTQLLKDPRPGIRRISAEALGKIGPDADALAALRYAAEKDADDRVRATARSVVAGEK